MFDSWESAAWTAGFILGGYGVVLWLAIVVWIFRDIASRTRDGWSQAVAVLLGALHVPGLFLYLVLRPHETLVEAYERRLEAEALKQELDAARLSCSTCRRSVKEDYLVCPGCRTPLREACGSCARPLELGWLACPYCAGPGPQRAATAAAAASSPASVPQPSAPPPPPPEPAAATSSSSRKSTSPSQTARRPRTATAGRPPRKRPPTAEAATEAEPGPSSQASPAGNPTTPSAGAGSSS